MEINLPERQPPAALTWGEVKAYVEANNLGDDAVIGFADVKPGDTSRNASFIRDLSATLDSWGRPMLQILRVWR